VCVWCSDDVDLRKRFEQEPINTNVEVTSTVQLQCLPPSGLPDPQVAVTYILIIYYIQLVNRKCMLSLLYGLEACPLVKSEFASLDFVVNRFFMKMFGTSNVDVVRHCQSCFGFRLPRAGAVSSVTVVSAR